MGYKDHALLEFQAAGWCDAEGKFEGEMQELLCSQVLELLEKFSEHGHSGSTAPYAINLFSTLAKFEPVVPLTGEDWEWNEVGTGMYQNRRSSHVFKDADRFDGQAYDIEAIIFWDWWTDPKTGEKSKSYFISSDSAQPITFPYTPKREYMERVE